MAVGVIEDHKGATLEQYDRVIAGMGLTAGGSHLPGCLFHWVAGTEDGIRIVDVWESRERYEHFAEQVGPTAREVGYPNPPQTTFYEVHNHLTAG